METERPAERVMRLMRQASATSIPASSGPIVVTGNGNVIGDTITIHHSPLRPTRRSDRRTLRASTINFIRTTSRRLGEPAAWATFTRAEFGVADLEALSDLQLERVRGWCAAQEGGRP